MILKDRIDRALADIENFQMVTSPSPLSPLRDKLMALLELFNVERSGNPMFIHYVQEVSEKFIKDSIAECAEIIGKDEISLVRIIYDSKRYSKCSVGNFYIACSLYQSPFLSESSSKLGLQPPFTNFT